MFEKLIKIHLITFCVLYPIWLLPETNFLSDLCIIVGLMVSLYFVYFHKNCLLQKEALPIFLILILILWVLIHLIFFCGDYELQLKELQSIWKRVCLSIIFGFGFGLSFFYVNGKKNEIRIIYIALSAPIIIYFFKLLIGLGFGYLGYSIPEYFGIYDTRITPHYIPKPEYLFIAFPALICSFINLYGRISYKSLSNFEIYNYTVIVLALLMFYNQKMKSGIFLFFFSFLIFIVLVVKRIILRPNVKFFYCRIYFLTALLVLVLAISLTHFNSNKTWHYLYSDIKVGIDIDVNQHWKYLDREGNPKNEKGLEVSRTTYDRVAWMTSGFRLLLEHPLGYGLLEYSFSHLAKEKWKGSSVPQTHNSWLDFGLAFGFPGLLLLLGIFFLTIIMLVKNPKNYRSLRIRNYVLLILVSYIPIYFISELDLKRVLPITFFWLAFSAGLNLLFFRKYSQDSHA